MRNLKDNKIIDYTNVYEKLPALTYWGCRLHNNEEDARNTIFG